MMTKTNLYNIQASYKFIETLGDWILQNYTSSFSELKIFLPNLRLSRNLKNYLNNQNISQANYIKIKSIAELNVNDFTEFLPNNYCAQIIDEILEIKVLSKVDAIFWLCEEIKKHPKFYNQNFAQRYKIAKTLYDLFEEIDVQQIEPAKIALIDNGNFAMHQQFTIEFFVDFYWTIKNFLHKNNLMFLQQYQNFLCDKFIDIIESKNTSQNIVIAGSTGSITSSKKLIKSISKYHKGSVILYGFNYTEKYNEINPQYFLNELVKYIEISPDLIININNHLHQTSNPKRQEFINLIFDDYKNFDILQKKCTNFIENNAIDDITQNIDIVECINEFDEANFISKTCLESSENIKKIGIICNNQNLSQILKLTLNTYKIKYNDSSSQSIVNTDVISFLMLIYEVKFNDFNSHNFLSFVKHKLFKKLYNRQLIEDFEIKIIRSDRSNPDLQGVLEKINNQIHANFIQNIYDNLPKDKSLKSLISSLEFFADNKLLEILSNSMAGEEINNYFSTILKHDFLFENSEDFKILFGDVSYFEKYQGDSRIDILSPIEARLLNYDIIIVSALNDGDFPKIDNHGWIGAKIKSELGVNKSLKKIGQNAYDFCNYLSNKKIILTNSASRLGAINIESSFLTRLKTLCALLNINLSKNYTNSKKNISPSAKKFYLDAPSPSVPNQHKPKNFYITEISKLLNNPYYIYVKKILQLEELKAIDYEPSYAEFGSFVHKALEEYIKDPTRDNFDKIFAEYFVSKQAKLIWYPKFQSFFQYFCEDNLQFSNCENALEQSISIAVNDINLKGKVDRVIIDNEKSYIVDYKTGATPLKKEVLSGLEPQLMIYAYILSEGILKNTKISELFYWKINNNDKSKIMKILDKENEIEQAILRIKNDLQKLFDYFSNESAPYLATTDRDKDDIKNLSRIDEWNN